MAPRPILGFEMAPAYSRPSEESDKAALADFMILPQFFDVGDFYRVSTWIPLSGEWQRASFLALAESILP